MPTSTNMRKIRKGWKESKDQVSISFCCNMTGIEIQEAVIINKFQNSRCLGTFDGVYVFYESNKTTFMTKLIFIRWLINLDESMEKNREILLLLDNVAPHKTDTIPKNIELMFLPLGSNSKTQPLDQGIIRSFKSHVSEQQLHHALEMLKTLQENAHETFKRFNVQNSII